MRKLTIEAWDDYDFFSDKKIIVVGSDGFTETVPLSSRTLLEVPEELTWLQFANARKLSNRLDAANSCSRITLRLNPDHPRNQKTLLASSARRDPIGPLIEELVNWFANKTYPEHAKRTGQPTEPLIAEWLETSS